MNMITLNCPSCGGKLELPDNLGVAHCMYCGTKILLENPDIVKEAKDAEKFKELCKTAMDSKNYNEAIQYCNSLLEINPKDVDAWIDKAIATYMLTTGAKDRYSEAMEYLKKAKAIAPENDRIYATRTDLTHKYALFINKLGVIEFEAGWKIYSTYNASLSFIAAESNSKKHFINAMNHYLSASNNAPDNLVILGNIELCMKKASFIEWSQAVHNKIEILENIKRKKEVEGKLPQLKGEADRIKNDIEKLKDKTGYFDRNKRTKLEEKLRDVMWQIALDEKVIAFEAPKVQFDW